MTDDDAETFACTCGKTFESKAARNGHTASCNGEKVTDDADTQADSETMQDTQSDSQQVAEVVNGFDQMSMEHVGGCSYRVLSWRNNRARVHQVNTDHMSCTCEDHHYNTSDHEVDVCDHLAYAVYMAPKHRSASENALWDIVGLYKGMHDTLADIEQQLQPEAAQTSQPDETDAQPSDDELADRESVAPMEAADRLQTAYDDVVEDMQVQAHDGLVWVQTGRDTPDTLPGPGNVEVFDAFLANPDMVTYVHDDHDLASKKPGEWWKNVIEPADVDTYIAEVLE